MAIDFKKEFSPFGRISRMQALIRMGIVIVLAILLVSVSFILIIPELVFLFIFGAISLYSFINWIKRLHDIGKSGWWAVYYSVAGSIMDKLLDRFDRLYDGQTPLYWPVLIALLALSIWTLYETLIKKGNMGANEYGADPLEQSQEAI